MVARFVPVLLAICSLPISAKVTTVDVISSSLCPDCIDYKVIGSCLWMTCTPVGCKTRTSIKVKHRLPDLVAMSYLKTGEAPWQATDWMSPANRYSKGGGQSNDRSPQLLDHTSVTFQNVDIIGHPAEGTFFNMLSSFGYVLEGPSTPMMPYYLSSLDPLGWRYNIPDVFNMNSWDPLGNRLGTFGDIYPRGGFSVQPHPYKSAALGAFKAVHLVTRQGESRVYQPLVAQSKPGYWPPKPLSINSDETAWQMLSPIASTTAKVWPDIDDSTLPYDPYAERMSDNGEYVWAVWRTYRGCKRKGAMLVAHFGD